MAVLPAPTTTTLLPIGDGRVEVGEAVAAHQVDAGEELVGAVDLAGELAVDAQEGRRARAHADEHRVVAQLAQELRDREGLADDLVGLDPHPHVEELLDLAFDDVARQPEARDAVAQDAPDHV